MSQTFPSVIWLKKIKKYKLYIVGGDKLKSRELIANNVIYFRHKYNWSQEKLADILNSSASYISQIENAKRNVTTDFLDKIATIFKVEPHELLINRETINNKRLPKRNN